MAQSDEGKGDDSSSLLCSQSFLNIVISQWALVFARLEVYFYPLNVYLSIFSEGFRLTCDP